MTHLDCLQLFAFVFLLPELLSAIILLISIVLSLHPLSALASLSVLGVLCTTAVLIRTHHTFTSAF